MHVAHRGVSVELAIPAPGSERRRGPPFPAAADLAPEFYRSHQVPLVRGDAPLLQHHETLVPLGRLGDPAKNLEGFVRAIDVEIGVLVRLQQRPRRFSRFFDRNRGAECG